MTYEVFALLRGPAGEVTTPLTPPTFEADSLQDALLLLAEAQLPDNSLIRTVGLTVKLVSDEPVASGPSFKDNT